MLKDPITSDSQPWPVSLIQSMSLWHFHCHTFPEMHNTTRQESENKTASSSLNISPSLASNNRGKPTTRNKLESCLSWRTATSDEKRQGNWFQERPLPGSQTSLTISLLDKDCPAVSCPLLLSLTNSEVYTSAALQHLLTSWFTAPA